MMEWWDGLGPEKQQTILIFAVPFLLSFLQERRTFKLKERLDEMTKVVAHLQSEVSHLQQDIEYFRAKSSHD